MGYLFPDRRDDMYDADEEPEREPDEEEQLEHLEMLLASPSWVATSGQRKNRLTGVLEVDAVRAEAEALREALGLDEPEGTERAARESDQAAFDAHADAAMAAAGGK